MRKQFIILGAAAAALSFFAIKNHHKPKQQWFTLENIKVNHELHLIKGTCTKGAYLGEMEVYLPDSCDLSCMKEGMDVKVLGGPGMSMSLPPQLMNCTKIEIIK